MKKIIKPSEREEAVFFSDVTGKSFGEFQAPVNLTLSFNYGSIYDGAEVTLDLDDDEVKPVIELLKKLVSEDYKKTLKNKLIDFEEDFESAVQSRDWTNCDFIADTMSFYKDFLDIEEKPVD